MVKGHHLHLHRKVETQFWVFAVDNSSCAGQVKFFSTGKCPVINGTENLEVSNSDVTVNTSVVFSCANKSHLVGASTVTCRPDGTWNDPIPRCVPDAPGESDREMLCR